MTTHDSHKNNSQFERGITELERGNVPEAISALKMAASDNPNDPRIYNNLGIAYELMKDYKNARSAFRKALELNPYNSAILNNLAELSRNEGKQSDAIELYASAIASDPMFVEPYLNVARLFLDLSEFKLAEPYVRKTIEIEPDNPEAHFMLGIISNITNRSEEAVTHFQEALRHDTEEPSILTNLGTAFRGIGDANRAIIAFEKAVEISPGHLSALNNLGLLYHETGRTDKAEEILTRSAEMHPENPIPLYNLAELAIAFDKYDVALEYLKKYTTLVPLDLDTLYKTAGIARMTNRLGEVVPAMETFVREANPDDKRTGTVKTWLASIKGVSETTD